MAQNQNTNPGNFANDREKASQAGQASGQHRGATETENEHSNASSQKGSHGSGNFANDRERAAEAGRKGGSR
jgi:general stress protein YciG